MYQFKDHLDNIRLSYKDANKDGSITQNEIVQEKNYYPFGLEHKGYNNTITGREHPYGLGNKEEQNELGLNWLDFGWRNYDPAIARWMNIDPMTDKREWLTPYQYVQNSPMLRIDPDGAFDIYSLDKESGDIKLIEKNDDKTDTLVDSESNKNISENVDKGLLSDGQNIMQDGLETSNVIGGMKLAVDISMHTKDEVGGVVYTDNAGNKMLNVLPYEHSTFNLDDNGKVISVDGGFSFKISPEFTSSDGNFTGRATSAFHTHPGHPNAGKDIIGSPQPSGADLNIADWNANPRNGGSNANENIKYYIFGAKNITKNGNTSNTTYYRTFGRWGVMPKGTDQLFKKK